MDFDKVKKALEDGSVTLIDVRKPEEHKEERIPGAKNLPSESLAGQAGYILLYTEVFVL